MLGGAGAARRLSRLGLRGWNQGAQVSGPKAARKRVMDLCPLVPGLRAIDGGPLANARIVEQLTALLIGLNVRHRVPEGIGIRFTGLD